jgi:hypothetical protein
MKNIKERIVSKLKSTAGESLAEVLIALLIAALSMAMLATAISSTAKIVTQSKATMADYYNQNNELDAAATGGAAITIEFDGVRLTDSEDVDGESQTFSVLAFQNTKSSKVPVVSYKLKE